MFDVNNIVLQFAAVSDLQHGTYDQVIENYDSFTRGQMCFRQLQEMALKYSDQGLNAVFFAGDIVNNALASQVESFKDVYEAVLDPAKVPFIFCLGNHDVKCGHYYARQELNMDVFYRILGDDYRTYDPQNTNLQMGYVHQVVNGYHFLTMNPLDSGYKCKQGDTSGAKYAPEAKEWLDRMLAEITSAEPDRYVFFATHPLIYGLAYGSEIVIGSIYWYTKELLPILNKYPQVIAFGGHLHLPISDERSIMQDRITGINCGAISYMAIENGNYRDMASAVVMKDAAQVSSGHLVQVDQHGNLRIIRMNFCLGSSIKEPWLLPAPRVDGSHLKCYTRERGDAAHNKPPVIPTDAITVLDDGAEDALAVTVTFRAGSDDDQIHYYQLQVTEEGREVETARILADSYLHATTAEMKLVWSLALKENTYFKGHCYTLSLTAYDSWNARSNEVVYEYAP